MVVITKILTMPWGGGKSSLFCTDMRPRPLRATHHLDDPIRYRTCRTYHDNSLLFLTKEGAGGGGVGGSFEVAEGACGAVDVGRSLQAKLGVRRMPKRRRLVQRKMMMAMSRFRRQLQS